MRASQVSPGHIAGGSREAAVRQISPRRPVELAPEDALGLLASTPFGRLAFTYRALPVIRLVNHTVDDGLIIIRTRLTSKAAIAVADQSPYPAVVAYEVDNVDASTRLGWSVVVVGIARPVTDADHAARWERLLNPWADLPMNTMLAIEPEIVTGFRLAEPM